MSTSRRRSAQRQRREEVRAQIIAAAETALRERPFRELTVEELMVAAGLSRTLFYRHFDDLGDLVVRLLEDAGTELYRYEERLFATGASDHDAVRAALEAPVRGFSASGPLLRAIAEASSHDERIDTAYRLLLGRFEALIEAFLRVLADRGLARLADPTQTARALNLMNVSYLLDVFGSPHSEVTPEVALQTLTEIWSGLIRSGPPAAAVVAPAGASA